MLDESELGPYMSYAMCVVCDSKKAYYSSIRNMISCPLCGAVSDKDGKVIKVTTARELGLEGPFPGDDY